jgi:hypothetical protein
MEKSPTLPITAIEGNRASFASTSMVLRPDSAKGKIRGDTEAPARSTRIVIIRFMKVLQGEEPLPFLPPREDLVYWATM